MVNRYKNNKGEVLITLMVALLIVSVLASSAMHFAATNLDIVKSYTSYSGKSYQGDRVMNAIKAGVQNECSDILKHEYDRMLDSYSFTPESERNLTFKEYYLGALENAFTKDADEGEYLQEKFKAYVTASEAGIPLTDSVNAGGVYIYDTTDAVADAANNRLTLKGVKVKYSGETGVASTVQADIVIQVPMLFKDGDGGTKYETNYSDFCLVSDKNITYDSSAPMTIVGGIYAGDEGINIGKTSSPELNIDGKYVATRGDISVYSGATLNIYNSDVDLECDILAKNINMERSGTSTAESVLNIDGNTMVADDLEINSENAKVILSGTYTGYGYKEMDFASNGNFVAGPDDGTANSDSSAIMLNAKNSVLDITRLNSLTIAGDAFISPFRNVPTHKKDLIMTGDSLTAKFLQIAYLVPSSCLSTYTNPVQIMDGNEGTYDYSMSKKTGGLDLESDRYAINEEPIKVSIPGPGATQLVYYFLRFDTLTGMRNYLIDYVNYYNEYVSVKANGMLEDGQVLVDEANLYSTLGNIISYTKDPEGNPIFKVMNGTIDETGGSEYLTNERDKNQLKANSMNSVLMYNQSAELTEEGLFNTVIDASKIDGGHEFSYYTLSDYEHVSMDSSVKAKIREVKEGNTLPYDCIVRGSTDAYVIPEDMKMGIVIANGDVTINHAFIGLIIAKGKITVQANGAVEGTSNMIMNDWEEKNYFPALALLMQYEDAESIRQYFKTFRGKGGGTRQSSSLNVINLVSFDNWAYS